MVRSAFPIVSDFQWHIDNFSTIKDSHYCLSSKYITKEVNSSIFERLGTYTHTNVGTANTTVDFFGEIFTRQAVMTVFDGTNVINMPLEVTYDGEGTPHHRLLFPYPVDASIAYTSVTVRYFLNPFIADNGNANPNSSITLRAFGISNTITVPMSLADLGSLNIAVMDSNTLQAHFVQRDGEIEVFDITNVNQETGAGTNESNFIYAGYAAVTLTFPSALYTFGASNTAPADTGAIVLTIDGLSFAADVPFAVGTDGLVNAPTQAEVTAGEFLRADNSWEPVQSAITDTVTLTSGSNSWTMTADAAGTLTIALNTVNAFRLTPNATSGNIDLAVTGDISGNQTIT